MLHHSRSCPSGCEVRQPRLQSRHANTKEHPNSRLALRESRRLHIESMKCISQEFLSPFGIQPLHSASQYHTLLLMVQSVFQSFFCTDRVPFTASICFWRPYSRTDGSWLAVKMINQRPALSSDKSNSHFTAPTTHGGQETGKQISASYRKQSHPWT